jgi:hypothetical protein
LSADEERNDSRGRIWLRALLFSPLVILGFAVIAGQGGYPAIPFDTVSGGRAGLKLAGFMLLDMLAMGGFAFSALMLYALACLHGQSALQGRRRLGVLALAAVLPCAYGLFHYVDRVVSGEIAAAKAGLVSEHVAPERWTAESCGRHGAVCIRWEGRLGRAMVRHAIGPSDLTKRELARWEALRAAGGNLTVEWGMTPLGWIAARSATAGPLRATNPWR